MLFAPITDIFCVLSNSRAEVALMSIANCQAITGQTTSSINSAIIIHYVAITSSRRQRCTLEKSSLVLRTDARISCIIQSQPRWLEKLWISSMTNGGICCMRKDEMRFDSERAQHGSFVYFVPSDMNMISDSQSQISISATFQLGSRRFSPPLFPRRQECINEQLSTGFCS